LSNQSKFLPLFWIPSNNYVSNLNTVHQKDEMILILRYIVKTLQMKFPFIRFAMKIPQSSLPSAPRAPLPSGVTNFDPYTHCFLSFSTPILVRRDVNLPTGNRVRIGVPRVPWKTSKGLIPFCNHGLQILRPVWNLVDTNDASDSYDPFGSLPAWRDAEK
jgi:hypothetical protein